MLGDHIRALKDGRWLHGIDLGDQRVLYLVEAPGLAPGDRLRRVYRPEFTAGSSKVELVVHREPAYPAKAVVARAWSRFMDPSVVAMFRDSEAFAAWCKIGRIPEAPPPDAAPASAAPAKPPAPVQVAAKRAVGTQPAARKAAPAKPASMQPVSRRAAVKKPSPERPTARKPARTAARKAAPRKAAPRKAGPKKAAPRKAPTRSAAKKKGRR